MRANNPRIVGLQGMQRPDRLPSPLGHICRLEYHAVSTLQLLLHKPDCSPRDRSYLLTSLLFAVTQREQTERGR